MLFKNLFKGFLFLFVSIAFISCEDDDPVSSQEEHFEAIGTAIYDATGALNCSVLRGETEDTLYAIVDSLSDHYSVKFYNDDEIIIDPPNNDHTSLGNDIDDESVVEWWQHEGEEGEFEFHLRGLKPGTTNLELFILHGEHKDYRSGKIPVKVSIK